MLKHVLKNRLLARKDQYRSSSTKESDAVSIKLSLLSKLNQSDHEIPGAAEIVALVARWESVVPMIMFFSHFTG